MTPTLRIGLSDCTCRLYPVLTLTGPVGAVGFFMVGEPVAYVQVLALKATGAVFTRHFQLPRHQSRKCAPDSFHYLAQSFLRRQAPCSKADFPAISADYAGLAPAWRYVSGQWCHLKVLKTMCRQGLGVRTQ